MSVDRIIGRVAADYREQVRGGFEGAAFVGEYKPKGMIGDGCPVKIRVKFKGSDKWVAYKR